MKLAIFRRRGHLLAILLVSILGASRAYPEALDLVSKTVVFLKHDFVETYSDNRGTFEIWLKQAGTNVFFPKMVYKGGSGLFVQTSNTVVRLYLVTAKHVATNMLFTENDKVITTSDDGKTAIVPLALFRGSGTNSWLHHDKADVSILPLKPDSQVYPLLKKHFLETIFFMESVTNSPSRDAVLTIVGFPLGKGWGREAGDEFAPLTRRTRTASGFLEGKTLLLLEDPSVEGYSGAPVFDLAEPITGATFYFPSGRPVTCVGIVSSTFSDNTGGKMGGVVPTRCVMELIVQHEAR